MSEAEPAVEGEDPFSDEHVHAFTLITLMRIYDVQMALLKLQNAEVANKLYREHEAGHVIGTFPWLDPEE